MGKGGGNTKCRGPVGMDASASAAASIHDTDLEKVRASVAEQAQRVARQGEWPDWIAPASLVRRVPQPGEQGAPGFDAGIGCALDLIPRQSQRLASQLHAAYTPEAIEQVRREAAAGFPEDCDTTWWLAACSVCKEGEVDEHIFAEQLEQMRHLAADPQARRAAAQSEFAAMVSRYRVEDGVPFGEDDGCIQGAYIDGYRYGTQYASHNQLFFVATYEESLGLEDFEWEQGVDKDGLPTSGPVHGSRQYVKCANRAEFERVMERVRSHLG